MRTFPMMGEIDKVSGTNGLKVVSTFSGCGGSCLGFEAAGYKVLYANEFIKAARLTYEANHPFVHVDPRDIREVKGEEILKVAELKAGEVDVLEGSPPCAGFSTAGKVDKKWGKVTQYSDTKQRVDDLFFEYIRLLKEVKPKVCVAENVKGLVVGRSQGYFLEIIEEFRKAGYNTKAKLLDAQWLEVPQHRERLIFIGVRKDIDIDPSTLFPSPISPRVLVKDAILDPADVLFCSEDKQVAIDTFTPCYRREYKYLRHGDGSDKFFNLRKLDPNEVSSTICQLGGSAAGCAHPNEDRKLTLNEVKRLCTFPDDFELVATKGTPKRRFAQNWERLGRAVPPKMMYHIAKTIAKGLGR